VLIPLRRASSCRECIPGSAGLLHWDAVRGVP
jgi:hypothetical protein